MDHTPRLARLSLVMWRSCQRAAADFKHLADQGRERSGGVPIGFELSANHIEEDIDFALMILPHGNVEWLI